MDKMSNVSVIILNYMNYKDTIACINSVLLQKNVDYQIVVVDNGSLNESYDILKRQYCNNHLVHVIKARKNYGFAKGNNIGIKYAKARFRSEFVLLINSDTVLLDEQYINILIAHYDKDVGVIGSEIILRDGKKQRPYSEFVKFPETMFFYLSILNSIYGISDWQEYIDKLLKKSKKVEILHGSAFMLTPSFFRVYDGLYSKTFLYTEEVLLYILCERVGLKQIYTTDTSIFHKEDQSSKYLFNNRNTDKMKYVIKSYKYVIWESFKNVIIKRGE